MERFFDKIDDFWHSTFWRIFVFSGIVFLLLPTGSDCRSMSGYDGGGPLICLYTDTAEAIFLFVLFLGYSLFCALLGRKNIK